MKDLIIYLLLVLVLLSGFPLLIAGIDYLIKKTSSEKLKVFLGFTKMAVMAAEQTLGAGTGEAKKQLVSATLSKKFRGQITTEEIEHLIEAAVYELNQEVTSKLSLDKGGAA
jgi:hypothetical protein